MTIYTLLCLWGIGYIATVLLSWDIINKELSKIDDDHEFEFSKQILGPELVKIIVYAALIICWPQQVYINIKNFINKKDKKK